jgi:hypothetical protein
MSKRKRKKDVDVVSKIKEPKTVSKRSPLVIISVVLVILIVVVTVYYLYPVPSEPPPNNTSGTVYTDEQIEIIVNSGVQHMRETILSDIQTLAMCVAVTEKDVSYCDLVENKEHVKECKQNYNQLLSYQNNCDGLVPIENPSLDFDKPFCEKLNSLSCTGLGGEMEKVCRYLVESNINLCLEFPGANNEGCSDYLNLYKAVKGRDANYCNQMTLVYNRLLCDSLLTGNCSATVDKLAKDWVYYQFAENNDEGRVCNKMAYDFLKNPCLAGEKFSDVAYAIS